VVGPLQTTRPGWSVRWLNEGNAQWTQSRRSQADHSVLKSCDDTCYETCELNVPSLDPLKETRACWRRTCWTNSARLLVYKIIDCLWRSQLQRLPFGFSAFKKLMWNQNQ
jgi:hypothetical protein